MQRLYSWNVNGIRAIGRKGFVEWLDRERPQVLCLQEVKAYPDDVPAELRKPDGYGSVWRHAQRKGYSGTATYFRSGFEPREVTGLGVAEFDYEGRVQVLEYDGFTLVNAYFPNSQPERRRLDYKLRFCDAIREFCEEQRGTGRHVILCGDYNIAHKAIDLARPDENTDSPGFLPEERASMDRFVNAGYVDTFRQFCPEPGHYTWWSYRTRARARNVGWRLDYHCVNSEFIDRVAGACILADVEGSDHCPVALELR